MSGPEPTDEQLDRIERRVRERIDARRRLPRQLATAVVVLGVIGGGFALAPTLVGTSGSGGSTAGGAQPAAASAGSEAYGTTKDAAGGTAAESYAPGTVLCFTTQSKDSPFIVTRLRGGPVAADAAAACVKARPVQTAGPSVRAGGATQQRGLVVCRDGTTTEVFAAGSDPATQCARLGLQPVAAG